jgi:hypothetical protein
MIQSAGVITGAGFETPAEALYLGKKLFCLPIRGQYEQGCNAAALQRFGVPIHNRMDASFVQAVAQWLDGPAPAKLILKESTRDILERVMDLSSPIPMQEHEQPDTEEWPAFPIPSF